MLGVLSLGLILATVAVLLWLFIGQTSRNHHNRKLLESSFAELNLNQPDKQGMLDGCGKNLYREETCHYSLSYYYKDSSYITTIDRSLMDNGWKKDSNTSSVRSYYKIIDNQKVCASNSVMSGLGGEFSNVATLGLSTEEGSCN